MRNESPIHMSTQMSVNCDGELCPIIGRFFLFDRSWCSRSRTKSFWKHVPAPGRSSHPARSHAKPLLSTGQWPLPQPVSPQPCPDTHPYLPQHVFSASAIKTQTAANSHITNSCLFFLDLRRHNLFFSLCGDSLIHFIFLGIFFDLTS